MRKMKSRFIIIFAVFLCVALLVSCSDNSGRSGGQVTKSGTSPDTSLQSDTDATEDSSDTVSKKLFYEKDGVKITFCLYDGWAWKEDCGEGLLERCGIIIYPDTEDNENTERYFSVCFYGDGFAVCGTGLETENTVLENGAEAHIGYYDGNTVWSHVSMGYEIPSFAAVNFSLSESESEDALEMIKQMTFSYNGK